MPITDFRRSTLECTDPIPVSLSPRSAEDLATTSWPFPWSADFAQNFALPATAEADWAAEAEAHTREWVRRLWLVRSAAARRHFDAITAGALASRVYPDALPGTRLTVTDWLSWLFVLDDQCDEGRSGRDPVALDALLNPVRAVLTDGASRQYPLAVALRDICARIEPVAPAGWWHQFSAHVLEYLDGCRWEATNRAKRRVPPLSEYPAWRRAAGAMMPTLDLIEFADGTYLPGEVRRLPAYQQAVEASADVVCWTDDIATADKESARGDMHNLVIVLMAERQCGSAEAATEASRMLHGRLADFLAAESVIGAAFKNDATLLAPARRNLAGLRAWMRGHLDWGLETTRYSEVDRVPGVPGYIENLSFTTPD